MKKQKKKNQELINKHNYILWPIIFVVSILPLIMRLHIYDSGLGNYAWFSNTDEAVDIFLYWKSILFSLCGIAMFSILVYFAKKEDMLKAIKETISNTKWIAPLLGFGLLAFISTIVSPNRNYGFGGIYEHFETIWVVLSYCVTVLYVFYFVRTKQDIDVIEKALLALLTILGLLGLTQLLGYDFWESSLGKALYVPGQYAHLKETLSFQFSGSGNHQVYLTLYNPNYVGVFAALILPVSTMLCIGHDDKKKKATWGILTAVIFLCALGSGSKAFLLVLSVTAVSGMIIYLRKHKKHLIMAAGAALVVGVLATAYMNYVNINLYQYVKNALTPVENNYSVEDFAVKEECVELTYKGNTISIMCEMMGTTPFFMAWDDQGNSIAYNANENGEIVLTDERFANIVISIYDGFDDYAYIAELIVEGQKYAFTRLEDGYQYLNYVYREDELVKADAMVFTNYDSLFTGRGYIWSRTIPLLKNSLILGTGADTFSLVFPQDDYVAKNNAGYQGKLISKPHCLFLQIGVQYGVIALICYIVTVLIYILQAFKLCLKTDFKDKYSCLSFGLMLGIVGYNIMGISNDSCVALAPLAWALLGLGFALNYILGKDRISEEM